MTIHNIGDVRAATRAADTPYGWLTPYLGALADYNKDIAGRILYLPRDEVHFIALSLSLMGERRDDADHFAAFARAYGVLTHKTLFAAHTPEAPAALANLAPKLAGKVWTPPRYRQLAALFHDASARKALRHLEKIRKRHVVYLTGLPQGFRTTAVLARIHDKRDLSEAVFAIGVVRRIRTDLTDAQICASLNGGRRKKIHEWVMKHYATAPFPAPPVGKLANGAVQPLENYDALTKAAQEFSNCIRTYLWRVLRGDSYFYRYAPRNNDKGVAIIELRRAPVIGWVVHEALGPANDAIKGKDRSALIRAFADAGVGAAPQAVNPDAWFNLD